MDEKQSQNSTDFLKELKEQAACTEVEETPSKTYTDSDGTVYEWDEEKRAWFPKVDEDFIAAYQMSYGFNEPQEQTETSRQQEPDIITTSRRPKAPRATFDPEHKAMQEKESSGERPNKKRKANEATWFDLEESKNTNIYVSGLPTDITEEEFITLMSKYGIIMEDPETKKPKVKLYQDESGKPKGDGRCCYLKIESVSLAIQMLDEMEYKNNILHVEQAKFQMKGSYNPALKPRKKKKKKKKQGQEKLLDWVDRDQKRPKCERIIVFKNMFEPKDFENNPLLVTEIRDDLKSECEKFGEVKKVIVFDRNPEGIASVAFKEFEPADNCVPFFNGRWFSGRRIVAEKWDGKSNFKIEETEQEKEERLKKWEEFLQES